MFGAVDVPSELGSDYIVDVLKIHIGGEMEKPFLFPVPEKQGARPVLWWRCRKKGSGKVGVSMLRKGEDKNAVP